MRLAFTPRYALVAGLLLAIELVIGLYVHDRFIRPFVGDLLVVWLIFFLCRSLLKTDSSRLLLAVWLFCLAWSVLHRRRSATQSCPDKIAR